MQLDKALQFAVVQSWEDLTRGTEPCSIRVEYQGEPRNLFGLSEDLVGSGRGLPASGLRLLDMDLASPSKRSALHGWIPL